jgi:hypothetical protein
MGSADAMTRGQDRVTGTVRLVMGANRLDQLNCIAPAGGALRIGD